jgi:Predicted membrane protein
VGADVVPVSLLRLNVAAAGLALPLVAQAHHLDGEIGATHGWNLEPWLLALLATSTMLYGLGVARLWSRAGTGRGITPAQVVRFALGSITLVAALVSPLDAWGERSFALHMIQHELLMVVAAPLLVTARPLEAFAWALPPAWARAFAGVARYHTLRAAWSAITEPVGAWAVHALALWAWHVPRFFDAALNDEATHIAQHTCFFVSALIFWWSVLARRARQRDGVAVASLFTTMMHTSVLGALLTFAPSVWYRPYLAAAAGSLSALEDQQLGGLIMWVPAGMAYIVAGLAIVATWLREPRAVRFR